MRNSLHHRLRNLTFSGTKLWHMTLFYQVGGLAEKEEEQHKQGREKVPHTEKKPFFFIIKQIIIFYLIIIRSVKAIRT